MLTSNLAINIKILRKQNNMTQTDLAEKLNIARQALSSYERGNIEPNIGILCKLADIFNTTIDEIIGRNINH